MTPGQFFNELMTKVREEVKKYVDEQNAKETTITYDQAMKRVRITVNGRDLQPGDAAKLLEVRK